MNAKIAEIEALLDVKPGFGIDWALDARKHLRYLLSEVRRLQAVVDRIASLWPEYHTGKPRPLMVAIDIARAAREKREVEG